MADANSDIAASVLANSHAVRLEACAFVGGGQMGLALARGWTSARLVAAEKVVVRDPDAKAVERFRREIPGAQVASTASELVRSAHVVVLAVKPPFALAAAEELAPHLEAEHLVISVVAGYATQTLEQALPGIRVIRVMPNTPCLIGRGVAAVSGGSTARPEDIELARGLMEAVGIAEVVPESLLDVVTAISGSGPAFVLRFMEALADGAVRMGMPRAMATSFATHTVLGTAALVRQSGQSFCELRESVASPGGTTMAGLYELEKHAMPAAIMAAVEAATLKSVALGHPEVASGRRQIQRDSP